MDKFIKIMPFKTCTFILQNYYIFYSRIEQPKHLLFFFVIFINNSVGSSASM